MMATTYITLTDGELRVAIQRYVESETGCKLTKFCGVPLDGGSIPYANIGTSAFPKFIVEVETPVKRKE